jgi:hypothetical protein
MHSSSLDGAVDQARFCRALEREIENMFVGNFDAANHYEYS